MDNKELTKELTDEEYEKERQAILQELSTYNVPTLEGQDKSKQFESKPFLENIVVKPDSNTSPQRISLASILAKKQEPSLQNPIQVPTNEIPIKETPVLPLEEIKEKEQPSFSLKESKPRFDPMSRAYAPRFEVPLDYLPSKGIYYPKNAKVIACEYLTNELDVVSIEIATTPLYALYQLMLEGIITKNFNSFDLTLDDFFSINKLRKESTLGDYQVSFNKNCPVCEKEYKFSYPLSSFTFKPLKNTGTVSKEFTFYYPDATTDLGIRQETKTLNFAPMTIGKLIELYTSSFLVNDLSYNLAHCTNYDLKRLLEVEFSKEALIDKNLLQLNSIVESFDQGFVWKKEKCKNKILDETTNQKKPCQGVIEFDPDPDFDLVLPFRIS